MHSLTHSSSSSSPLTGVSTMLGLLFLKVFTAWKTSTTLCLLDISHTMLLAQKTPLRPPPFLHRQRQECDGVHRIQRQLVNRLHEHVPKREGGQKERLRGYSQAVHNGSPLSLLPLTLPLVHLQDQLQEGALGGRHVPVSRPAQILELTHHQVAFLRLTQHSS